jgi:hypothetical protein
MKKKLLSLLLLVILGDLLVSQVQISGKVYDFSTGEPLAGVNIFLPDKETGTSTGIDGNFKIKVSPGNVRIRFSYIGYKTLDTLLSVNKDIILEVRLKPDVVELGEVQVTGSAIRDNSSILGFIAEKQISTSIFDGLSYRQIKMTIATTSADLMSKVVGVSVKQNKFVNVRGIDERYNVVTLNGSILPGTEPDKRSFAFDLIPAGLVQSVKIVKTFTPDLPGSSSGGFIDITTLSFPESTLNEFGFSLISIPGITFNSFSVYGMDKLSLFGVSDGKIGLPSDFPSDISKIPVEQRNLFAKEIPNLLNKNSLYHLPDLRMSFLRIGKLFKSHLSYSMAVNYRRTSLKQELELYEYEGDWSKRFEYQGSKYEREVQFGGLIELQAKFSNHTIGLRGISTMMFEDMFSQLRGFQYTDQGAEQIHLMTGVESRNLNFAQIYGEHSFGDVNLNWKASSSTVRNNQPDSRRLVYGRDISDTESKFVVVLGPQANLKNGGILFSDLRDEVKEIRSQVKFPIWRFKFTSGLDLWQTKRNFEFRLIGVVVNLNGWTDYRMYYLPPDSIFIPDNFRRNGFSLDEYKNGTNRYKATDRNIAYYLNFELPFRFKAQSIGFVSGVRVERVNQKIYTRDFADVRDVIIEKNYIDFLPSVLVKYSPSHFVNLKLSYSQTINKPELREIAPFLYFDFYTQTSVRGDSSLRRAVSFNYDLRFEIFSKGEDMLSVGVFNKHIKSPIEKVVVSGSALGSERTFKNAKYASVYGAEIEFVKNVKFLKFIGNFSVIKSSVDVEGTEGTIERRGRSLQGQAPYMANLYVAYEKPDSRFNFGVLFGLIGPRVYDVSTQYQDDIIETARYQIDLRMGLKLTKVLSVNLTGKNLTATPIVLKQGNYIYRKVSTNASVSIDFTVKL